MHGSATFLQDLAVIMITAGVVTVIFHRLRQPVVLGYIIAGIIIGLLGVAASFSAQTLARAREFGILRYIGMTRSQILGMLGMEGACLTALGITFGSMIGWCISLILVFIMNPQSFHWTMQFAWPGRLLAISALGLLVLGTAAAVLAALRAVGDPVRTLAEDT